MRSALSMLALTTVCSAHSVAYVEQHESALWASFKQTYRKQYSNADEVHRRAIFKANMLTAASLEAGSKTASYGDSPFADLSAEEFRIYHSSVPTPTPSPARIFSDAEVLELSNSSIDWRTKGVVGPVRNQGTCGSDWTFAAAESIEAQWVRAGHNLTILSGQEILACDNKTGYGCSGGMITDAFQWLLDYHGGDIVTEESYPYTAMRGQVKPCNLSASMPVGATITKYDHLPHDEDDLATWMLTNGPFALYVDGMSWQTYSSGVMDNCKGTVPDHAVFAVGVTPDFWIIKNSWGAGWGESGYIRLARGSNQCGLTNNPSTAVI